MSRRVTLALSVLWIVGAFVYLTRRNGEWPHGVVLFGPTCVLSLISWAITTVAARRRARRFLAMDASARAPENAT